jgi:hypothetical protein
MRHRYIGGAVLAAVVAVGWPSAASAQEGGFQVPLNTEQPVPIPTGQAGQPGFYFSAEYVMLFQTKAIGYQVVAVHGFNDSSGVITGVPGTLIGSGQPALTTNMLGGSSLTGMPGFRAEIGYKFDTGTRIYVNYMQTYKATYSAGATLATQGFKSDPALADTYLSSPVYNFPNAFGGPAQKTSVDVNSGFNTYGIWNGASTMDTKFTQRYQQADLGLRAPLFATDYSSIYALAGGRFAWFFERYTWRTADIDNSGNSTPQDVANYTNTLSQRMYGMFVGCGHEIYLGNMFSASLDLTAAGFMDVIKGRAKYELGDQTTESKYGRETFSVVPSGTADLNLWFYPVEGVQMRIGYQANTFFFTRQMTDPIGFNFGNIDPNYGVKVFRLVHGFNVGIGFFF